MFLFYAMDLYGRVPVFMSSNPTVQEMKLQDLSVAFKHMVSELQAAENDLSRVPSHKFGEYYGRMTASVAEFLLAKVLLNAEVYADDDWTDAQHPDASTMMWDVNGETLNTWQAVERYCNVISSNGFKLADDFKDNFSISNEESPELIFTIPMDIYNYSNRFSQQFRSLHYNHASALGLNGENGPCATIEAMNTFGYGKGIDTDIRLYWTYYYDQVYHDQTGEPVTLDDGSQLVYYPMAVKLDLTNDPYEKTAGARMKK